MYVEVLGILPRKAVVTTTPASLSSLFSLEMSGNLGVLVLVLGSLDRLKFHFGKMKVADIQKATGESFLK